MVRGWGNEKDDDQSSKATEKYPRQEMTMLGNYHRPGSGLTTPLPPSPLKDQRGDVGLPQQARDDDPVLVLHWTSVFDG